MYTGYMWMYTPVAKGPSEDQAMGRGPEMLQLCGKKHISVVERKQPHNFLYKAGIYTYIQRYIQRYIHIYREKY